MTPGRTTTLTLDVSETVLIESGWSKKRRGAEVARLSVEKVSDSSNRVNVHIWNSGAWTLKPVQHQASTVHEYTRAASYIIPSGAMTLIQSLVEIAIIAIENAHYVPSDLPGFSVSTNIQASGDGYFVPRWPAGQTWNNMLTSDVTTLPIPPPTTADIPLNRIGVSTAAYGIDQGFYLKWVVPGTSRSYAAWSWSFYFGQYGLAFAGDGRAYLFEWIPASRLWRQRYEFRFCSPGQVHDTAHNLAIFPHSAPDGTKFISFASGNAQGIASVIGGTLTTDINQIAGVDAVYVPNPLVIFPDADNAPAGHVTKAGPIRFDMRRDLRVKVQISKLGWETSGTLLDIPDGIPNFSTGMTVTASMDAVQPAGTSITPTLLDTLTNAAVTSASKSFKARFAFASDGNSTPTLWGYSLNRLPVTQVITPGSFAITGTTGLTAVSLSGKSGDPSQETGSFTVQDDYGQYSRLAARGEFSAKLTQSYTPPGGSLGAVTLARGYVKPVQRTQKGRVGRSYPSPNWAEYDLTFVGMWARLQEQDYPGIMQTFADNSLPFCPEGATRTTPLTPWKVTDAIVYLLKLAGFPAGQINITSRSVRLWPGTVQGPSVNALDPGANIADKVKSLARAFLGAALIYDETFSTDGAWSLLYGTPLPSGGAFLSPLWNFTTGGTTAAAGVLGMQTPSAFGGYGHSLIIGEPHFTNLPPAFNNILVTCPVPISPGSKARVETELANVQSYAVPGSSITPSPGSPHYLGRLRRYIHADPSLQDATPQLTQANCDWVALRLFAVTCYPQKLVRFVAPFVLVQDPMTTKYRSLRFQDPVTYNGSATWLVKSCAPHYNNGRVQTAEYELIQPQSGQVIHGGHFEFDMARSQSKRQTLRESGFSLKTNLFGVSSLPANQEQSFLSLPVITQYQTTLQNADGSFNLPTGYS